MSRRTILIIIWIVMVVGVVGSSYVGYRWFNRRKPVGGVYKVVVPEGQTIREYIKGEEKLMESDEILKGVIEDLDLTNYWGHDSETETLAHLRENLLVQQGKEEGTVGVIYLDRNKEKGAEIFKAIISRFVEMQKRRQQR